MERFENNNKMKVPQDQYRKLYDEIYRKVYDRAFNDGYKEGREDGYHKGYEHAQQDHVNNERAVREKHLTDMRWHGKNSKSWSWI